MNLTLQREILKHIFKSIGIFPGKPVVLEPFTSERFLIDKKMVFEIENEKYERNIWALSTKVENAEVKIIIADITEEIPEFALIIQMDNFLPCALRLSLDEDDNGAVAFSPNDNEWFSATTLFQGRILVGIESLTELLIQWNKIEKYSDIYKILIGYLNNNEKE